MRTFGLCKECIFARYGFCGATKVNCLEPSLKGNVTNLPLDFGCNSFKRIRIENYDYSALALRSRMCKLEKRISDIESFIRTLEKPVSNKLKLADSICWECAYVNVIRGKCDHPNELKGWEYPSKYCMFYMKRL